MGFNSGFKGLMHNSFFMYVYFCSLHVSGSHVPIIRRDNCINTTSGICHSVYVTLYRWPLGVQVWMRHFIVPDGSTGLAQFCFDVLILMCLFCLFCIAEFYVLLTVHLGIIFVNNQLDTQFSFMYVYFYSLYVSDSHVPIIRRSNCINTTSGICHSV